MRQTNDACPQLVSCEVNHSLHECVIRTLVSHTQRCSPAFTLIHPSRHTLEEEMKQAHQSKHNCSARDLIFQTESL